jgi:large subunit ribosomal protein L2
MGLKSYKPTTPSRRATVTVDYSELSKRKSKPSKKLSKVIKKRTGRSRGTITVRHRGSGNRRKYRQIDFRQERHDVPAKVEALEYDPYRTAFVALVRYPDGEDRYILAADGMEVGQEVLASEQAEAVNGNRLPLKKIPAGTPVYNIEMVPGRGGRLIRTAGGQAQLMAVEGRYAQLKLASGEVRLLDRDCWASVGQISNPDHSNIKLGKAGRSRWKGRRPVVRGSAMNPVDHPHGGGEGCAPIGLKHPKTPWGKPALGFKTRKKYKRSNKFIVKRRKK